MLCDHIHMKVRKIYRDRKLVREYLGFGGEDLGIGVWKAKASGYNVYI